MANFSLEDLRIILKSFVISSPGDMTIQQLQRDFKASEGKEIPYSELGFRNIWDFMGSLSDIIEIRPDRTLRAVRTSETQHLQDLIQRQRRPKKKRSCHARFGPRQNPLFQSRVTSYSHYDYTRQKTASIRNQNSAWSGYRNQTSNQNRNYGSRNVQPVSQYGRNYTNQTSFDSTDYSDSDSFELSSPVKEAPSYQPEPNFNREPAKLGRDVAPRKEAPSSNPLIVLESHDLSAVVPDGVKATLKEIIRDHPPGVLSSQLSWLYQKKFGRPIDCRSYGFSSMLELVDYLPKIYMFEDKISKDWVVSDNEHSSPALFNAKRDEVYGKVAKIVRTLKAPVEIAVFDKLYEKTHGVSLGTDVECFGSMMSFLASMDTSIIRIESIDGVRLIAPGQSEPHEESDSSNSDAAMNYPKGVVRLGCKVPRLERFSDAIVPIMDVKLAEVYSPEKFYVVNSPEDCLSERLRSFYSDSEALSLANVAVKRGLYCAAPYMDKWHRAQITNVVTPSLVRVFLIDFGTQLPIAKTKLRFLHSDFAAEPRKAIKAKLHNVAPLENAAKFSKEANQLFFELTADKNLKAYVKGIDFSAEPEVKVRLASIDQDKETFIDEKLVAAGVVQFENVNSVQSKVSDETNSTPVRSHDAKNTEEVSKLQNEERKLTPSQATSPAALLRSMLVKTRRLNLNAKCD